MFRPDPVPAFLKTRIRIRPSFHITRIRNTGLHNKKPPFATSAGLWSRSHPFSSGNGSAFSYSKTEPLILSKVTFFLYKDGAERLLLSKDQSALFYPKMEPLFLSKVGATLLSKVGAAIFIRRRSRYLY